MRVISAIKMPLLDRRILSALDLIFGVRVDGIDAISIRMCSGAVIPMRRGEKRDPCEASGVADVRAVGEALVQGIE